MPSNGCRDLNFPAEVNVTENRAAGILARKRNEKLQKQVEVEFEA